MPHILNHQKITENIFVLQNFALASKDFCTKYQINRCTESESEYDWYYYFGWAKSIVSEKLIECAINLRILNDFARNEVKENEYEVDLEKIEKESQCNLDIGKFTQGEGILTTREACNKIIHATDFRLVWKEFKRKKNNKMVSYEYWTGHILLQGSKGKRDWEVILNLTDFCVALERLYENLDSIIDWHHINKWDE